MKSSIMSVIVRAHARIEKVERIEDVSYRVWVRTQPEKGAANARVIELLSEHLGVKRSQLTIVRGLSISRKQIRLER